MIGPALFVLVFTLEGWLRPGYDPLAMYVSALSLGPSGWIQITQLLCVPAHRGGYPHDCRHQAAGGAERFFTLRPLRLGGSSAIYVGGSSWIRITPRQTATTWVSIAPPPPAGLARRVLSQ
jgi:hypothetical protein